MKDTLIANQKADFKTCCRWASKIKHMSVSNQTYHHSKTLTLDSYIERNNNQVKVTIKLDVYVSSVKDNNTLPLLQVSTNPSITQTEKEEIINILDNLVQTLKITSPP
ncbi:hypothetical protein NIES2101_30805 [Calothrix sp. HK-06]|nr:hypothetical protein NIES2101_30805 [Calothrix sp. HK-06]